MSERYYLKKGDRAYSTGVFLIWMGNKWEVEGFEDDTFFDGEIVNDVESKPYIGDDEDAI